MAVNIFCGNCGRALKTAYTLEESFSFFCCTTVALLQKRRACVAEKEFEDSASVLRYITLLQKLQKIYAQ